MLGQINPLIASPLELATNSDFFTGQQYSRTDPNDYTEVSGPLGLPINLLAKLTGKARYADEPAVAAVDARLGLHAGASERLRAPGRVHRFGRLPESL